MSNEEKEFRKDLKNFLVLMGMMALAAFVVVKFILVK